MIEVPHSNSLHIHSTSVSTHYQLHSNQAHARKHSPGQHALVHLVHLAYLCHALVPQQSIQPYLAQYRASNKCTACQGTGRAIPVQLLFNIHGSYYSADRPSTDHQGDAYVMPNQATNYTRSWSAFNLKPYSLLANRR